MDEFLRFMFQAFLEGFGFRESLRGGVVSDFFRDFHGAELWAAHGAEMDEFGAFLRQGLVVELAGGDRVEAQV